MKASVRAATLANKSALKNENMSNKQLAEQFHKPIIRKFNKIKVQRIWKDFTINNIKKTGLGRVPQFFSVDLNKMATENILDIHKYLMKKNISNVWVS